MTKGRKPSHKHAVQEQAVTAQKGKSKTETVSLPKAVTWMLLPQHMFAILALVFGSAFILTTPPFQVPDEAAHFFRVFSLSEFDVAQDVEGTQTGDLLPSSLDSAASIFNYLKFVPANKVPDGQIMQAMHIRLDSQNRKFTWISAGNYIYPSYLPQLPAMWIGRLLDLNVLYILYFGRFMALLFYILCVWQAIRSIPAGKYLLLAVALMPMCLAQAGSFSPDCVSFAFAFLSLAIILKYAFARTPLALNLESAGLAFMLVMMGVIKPVYFPIVLLVFIIPPALFGDRRRYLLFTIGTIFIAILLTVGWLKLMSSIGMMQVDVDINGRPTDPSGKVSLLLNNPMMFTSIFNETIDYFGKMYFQSTIGILGYLDTYLPGWVYAGFTILFLALALFEGRPSPRLCFWQRGIMLGVSVSVFLATILAMYLFTRIKNNLVAEGVQGRYFIPVLFTFLASFQGWLPARLSLRKNNRAAIVVFLFLICLMLATQYSLYFRYYE